MDTTIIKTADIAIEFAQATKFNDIELLESLLHDNGEFQIQDRKNEVIDSNKNEFIKWYKNKLDNTPITDIVYDQCIHCHIGNRVVIFNDGQFPRTIKDSAERSKTGLMIVVKDGKIITLKFCFVFLKTENKYQYECELEMIEVLKKQGLSFSEAFLKVTGIELSDTD
ncbi:MAG: hypothetical protein H7296_07830 [Bacteroidia bacterium]|nr:hypothetical protein [Bacteroidia bacterium]